MNTVTDLKEGYQTRVKYDSGSWMSLLPSKPVTAIGPVHVHRSDHYKNHLAENLFSQNGERYYVQQLPTLWYNLRTSEEEKNEEKRRKHCQNEDQ